MNRMTKSIAAFTVVAVALLVTYGCNTAKAPRARSASVPVAELGPEDGWSEPVNLWNLNTEREDKRPYITPDGSKLHWGGVGRQTERDHIWTSHWTGSGWSDPVQEKRWWPGGGITLILTQDGKTGFFQGPGGINYATREDDHWSEPTSLGPDAGKGGLPTVTANGDTLYLWCVNREGNLGKEDIWRTRRAGNAWQKDEHLGPQINTDGDEYCPWITADGRVLYFGRTHFTGQGAEQHIWACHIDNNGVPDDPVQLGPKFNVPGYSSCCVTMTTDGKKMVFASSRPGGKGDWDLWMMTRK